MKATVDKFGGIDILVNNAGVLDTGLAPIDKFDDVEIQKLISINQVGTMQCIRAALEYMQEGSSIVNVASVAGVNGGGGAACFHQICNHRYYKAYRFTSCRQIHSL